MASKDKVFVQVREELSPITGLAQFSEQRVTGSGFTFSESRFLGLEGVDTQPDSCYAWGVLWVTWVRTQEEKDFIMLAGVGEDFTTEEIKISSTEGVESSPRIVPLYESQLGERSLFIIWCARRKGEWLFLGRRISTDGRNFILGKEEVIDTGKEGIRAPAAIRMIPRKNGEDRDEIVLAAWEKMLLGRRQICIAVRRRGSWSRAVCPEEYYGDCYRPHLAALSENECYLTYDENSGASYNIRLVPITVPSSNCRISLGTPQSINKSQAFSFHSSGLAGRDGRFWLAYASTLRPNRDGDLIKWIHIFCLDSTKECLIPSNPMPDVNMDQLGEDQGWEFPSLIEDMHGRVWVFGRSSHSFHAQYFEPASGKWSPRVNFALCAWGCRGNRVSLNCDDADRIWVVYRGQRYIEIQSLSTKASDNAMESNPGGPENTGHQLENTVLRPTLAADFAGKNHRVDKPTRFRTKFAAHNGEEYLLYFGDLHSHSYHSDGTGDIDEFFARCRDLRGMDFAALTDHEYFCQKSMAASSWGEMSQMAQAFNRPEEFVAFPGYEWTGKAYPGPGHKHAIFPFDYPPLFSKSNPAYDDLRSKEFAQAVRQAGGIAIPHHTGWAGIDWHNHDPAVEPLIEICSCHGANEYLNNSPIPQRSDRYFEGHFVRDLLKMGLRFGLCGGTDNHGLLRHHGISWTDDTSRSGLTAVYARNLTREDLWEAMLARRTYATSGALIVLSFSANGHPMGSEITCERTVELEVYVRGTAELAQVTLVKNAVDETTWNPSGHEFDISIKNAPPSEGSDFYYIRVVQEDGHMAWSSPIWIDRNG